MLFRQWRYLGPVVLDIRYTVRLYDLAIGRVEERRVSDFHCIGEVRRQWAEKASSRPQNSCGDMPSCWNSNKKGPVWGVTLCLSVGSQYEIVEQVGVKKAGIQLSCRNPVANMFRKGRNRDVLLDCTAHHKVSGTCCK